MRCGSEYSMGTVPYVNIYILISVVIMVIDYLGPLITTC